MPVVLGMLGAVAIFFAALATEYFRSRRARARADAEALALLAQVATTLGLEDPRLVEHPLVRCASRGRMHGLDAELGVSGSWGRVSVRLVVSGLPAQVRLLEARAGRDVEDFYLGMAVNSGDARFDANYCLYGLNACTGDVLIAAGKTVPRGVLDFVASHFDPAYEIELSARELVVKPIWEPGREPSDDLVALWRFTDRLVGDGLERAVLTVQI